jgi:hypothetical protein
MEAPNVTHETDLDPEIFGQEKNNEKWKAIINQLHPNEKFKYSKNIPKVTHGPTNWDNHSFASHFRTHGSIERTQEKS